MPLPSKISEADRIWLSSRLPGLLASTFASYASDLFWFAVFFSPELGETDHLLERSLSAFLRLSAEEAHRIVWMWRDEMMARGLRSSGINRKLSSLRTLATRNRQIGASDWILAVPNLPAAEPRHYELSPAEVERIISVVGSSTAKAARDSCALRLSWDLALRRSELVSLDLEDISGKMLSVRRKGGKIKALHCLPERTQHSIQLWLGFRKELALDAAFGALFMTFALFPRAQRLGVRGWTDVLARRSQQALGRRISPHALRHASITCALSMTGGDVAAAAAFADHSDVRTTLRYDDARSDRAAKTAELVSRAVSENVPLVALSKSALACSRSAADLHPRETMNSSVRTRSESSSIFEQARLGCRLLSDLFSHRFSHRL